MSLRCTTHFHACDCREEKFKQLQSQLDEANKVIGGIRETHELVCDYFLAVEEHSQVVGVSLSRESSEKVRIFWDAHQLFDNYQEKYLKKEEAK